MNDPEQRRFIKKWSPSFGTIKVLPNLHFDLLEPTICLYRVEDGKCSTCRILSAFLTLQLLPRRLLDLQ